MILMIDNFDSFTYNLVHYLGDLGEKITVKRNNAISVENAINLKPKAIILSPGPSNPNNAGICIELTKVAALENIPLMGVCLGHQTIGQAFGGMVTKAQSIMHGKTSLVKHTTSEIFRGIPSTFVATRYHSLIVSENNLPNCLRITSRIKDGTIMSIEHKYKKIYGVQFHPESIASEYGHKILSNFLAQT